MQSHKILIDMVFELPSILSLAIMIGVLGLGGWMLYMTRESSFFVQILISALALGLLTITTLVLYG